MNLVVLTAATVEPVTSTVAKLHCRIDSAADDDLISILISAARDHVERFTRRTLVNTTYRLRFDYFPTGPIRLPRSPVSAISIGGAYAYALPRVRYYNSAGALTTMVVDTDYELTMLDDNPPQISLLPLGIWPIAQLDKKGAVEVDFVAGYGATAADVPAMLRQAMLMLIAHWYEHRLAVDAGAGTEVPLAVDTILRLYQTGDYQ